MKNFIDSLFSKEKINTKRQIEIDLLRGFALLLMCICHSGLFLVTESNTAIYYITDLVGSEPAGPVFMVLMGMSVIYSRKQSALDLLKRGLMLFGISYLLNIMRSFPYWIVGEIDYFACKSGFFVVDILQFAGLAFILFGLLKLIKLPNWSIFLISVGMLITGQILMSNPSTLDFSNEEAYFLNLLLPLENEWCCFNLMTWFIYPSYGLVLGDLLIRCKNKNKFYLILLVVGSIGLVSLYLNMILRFPNYTEYYYGNNFYRMGVLESFITILFVSFLLAFWHFISKILPSFIKEYLSFLSKNITVFYIAQWTIIALLIHLQAYYSLSFTNIQLILFMFLTILYSSLILFGYLKLNEHIKNKKLNSIVKK